MIVNVREDSNERADIPIEINSHDLAKAHLSSYLKTYKPVLQDKSALWHELNQSVQQPTRHRLAIMRQVRYSEVEVASRSYRHPHCTCAREVTQCTCFCLAMLIHNVSAVCSEQQTAYVASAKEQRNMLEHLNWGLQRPGTYDRLLCKLSSLKCNTYDRTARSVPGSGGSS